ncbi:MAG: HlyD family efflux transporter periplasmic adaptor subunit [Sediminibacterium sp.]|nr:HlyD family efflux transporter periplasmic adaptor subunit [Sediminibacterium sp.]
MDSAISEQVITRQKRKRGLIIATILVLLLLAAWFFRSLVKTSIDRSAFTTAVVEMGSIENTLNASGEVIPEFEQVITSPINAAIQNVLLDAGSKVKPGQSILALDKAVAQLELEKGKFQLELKKNNIQKLQLELNKSFYDLKANDSIKQLRINSLEASLADARRLFKAGGGTRESIEQVQLNLQVAQLEKKQLENEIKSKQQTMRMEIRESELGSQIQEKDLGELQRKLSLADIKASREGVITWVNKNIGSAIKEGESLVRIADLAGYKVSGSIADSYSEQLRVGMPAIIRINETQLRGEVVNIHPSVQNNIVSFDIKLDEQGNKLLRPNLKVDVFLVTAAKAKVMRINNGPAFKGGDVQDLFIVRDGIAERRTVHTGMSNFDFVELKDNVKPGDVVIATDMSEYKNAKMITIKN